MEKKNYQYLPGKTKREVLDYLGDGLNYFHADSWIYVLHSNWWGSKRKLIIEFREGKVAAFKIKNCW